MKIPFGLLFSFDGVNMGCDSNEYKDPNKLQIPNNEGVLEQLDHFQLPRVDIDLGEKILLSRPVGIASTVKIRAVFYIFCFYNFGSLREASVPQIAFRSPSSEAVIGIPVPSVEKSTNPSGDKSGR